MIREKLTKAQEKCLRDQIITEDHPGPILRDFRVILNFLGTEGVEATEKSNLIAPKYIPELDGRLSRPLDLKMKRLLLTSHPYLQGLNLLLRASGLGRVERLGAKARLVLDPEMLMQWDQLNPTEQYFNLLEAWLRFGRAEMAGERDRPLGDLISDCVRGWQAVPEKGEHFDLKNPQQVYIPGFYGNLFLLALMDLFGFLKVGHPDQPVSPWRPSRIEHVPFGDAMMTLVALRYFGSLGIETFSKTVEDEDEEEGASAVPQFGAWQPIFQPFFPEWKKNLELPTPESREGTYVFRVSLGKIWRLIAIPADDTLEDLLIAAQRVLLSAKISPFVLRENHGLGVTFFAQRSVVQWILSSVNFDSDHLYEFTYRNRLGAMESAFHPYMDEGPSTDEVPIGSLPLEPGQTMDLTYDFGDNWKFKVKLERIEPPGGKKKGARILEKHGKSPEQYPHSDW